MPRQKYGGHFSRATVFQRRGFSTLSRQTIARRPFLVNRVICPLIKRVINSTGSSYALLKTDSRPVHFACFALVDSRHIATRFNIFSSCFFNLRLFRFFFFLCKYLSFFFSARIRPSLVPFYTIVSGKGRINSWLNRAIREQRFMDYYGRDFREK